MERVLAGLDDEQRAAVAAPAGPVCILAGAGTGKTRAITHRIGYRVLSGEIAARHVLAVTFTARAAAELRARLAALGVEGVQARTFHAAALRASFAVPADRLVAATDCASLVEASGGTVAVVTGEDANLKITTSADLAEAERRC